MTIGMALGDPLQWLITGFAIVVVLGFIAYILMRVLRTLDKADKYFESREKESGQPKSVTIYRVCAKGRVVMRREPLPVELF